VVGFGFTAWCEILFSADFDSDVFDQFVEALFGDGSTTRFEAERLLSIKSGSPQACVIGKNKNSLCHSKRFWKRL